MMEKNNTKNIMFALLIILIFITGILSMKPKPKLKQDIFVYELGEKVNTEVDKYFDFTQMDVVIQDENKIKKQASKYEVEIPDISKEKEDTYKCVLKNSNGKSIINFNIQTKDTTPPAGRVVSDIYKVESGQSLKAYDLVTDVVDQQETTVVFCNGKREMVFDISMGDELNIQSDNQMDESSDKMLDKSRHIPNNPVLTLLNDANYRSNIIHGNNSPGHIEKIELDNSEALKIYEEIILEDQSGNQTRLPITIIVYEPDVTPPTLRGLSDKVVYIEDAENAKTNLKDEDGKFIKHGIDWLDGVEAEDDRDGNLKDEIRVDLKGIDFKTAGEYEAVYSVKDKSDNQTKETIKVEVKNKEIVRAENTGTVPAGDMSSYPEFRVEGNVSPELINYAFQLYMTVPASVRDIIRNTGGYLMVSDNPDYTNGGHAGTCHQKNDPRYPGMIAIYATSKNKVTISVQHECGHYLDNYLGISTGQAFTLPYYGQWISSGNEFMEIYAAEVGGAGYASYNSTDQVEFFAETFRRMIIEPKAAASRTPRAVEYIKRFI